MPVGHSSRKRYFWDHVIGIERVTLMKRLSSAIMLAFLLYGTLVLTPSLSPLKTSGAEDALLDRQDNTRLANNDTNDHNGKSILQPKITEHRITSFELEELRREIGVYEGNGNYDSMIDGHGKGSHNAKVINGHGTGLRAPTEEEWAKIAANTYMVETVTLESISQPPDRVDLSASPWFPPIGDQDGESSCVSWATGYYVKTFQEAKEHGWNLTGARWDGNSPTPEYQDKIISPAFIYHLTNWGGNSWTYYYDAINVVCSIGACSWAKMPWNPYDQATWPSENAWREAPYYRGAPTGFESMSVNTDDGILNLKNWIASENLAVIGVDAGQYSSLTSDDVWTVDNYGGGSNHANTIVGYDDNITYLEGGQLSKGAFKVANSWGVGGWENVADGFYWISYKAMSQRVGYVMFYRDRIWYVPTLASSFRIEHPMRGECNVVIGMGTHDNPRVSKSFTDYIRGGNHPFCPNDMVFDITEFKDAVPNVYGQKFYVTVYDGGSSATGVIRKFAIESVYSKDTPVNTINGNTVWATVTLSDPAHVYFESGCDKLQWGSSWSQVGDIFSWFGSAMQASSASPNGGCLYGPYITSSWDGESMFGKPYVVAFRLKVSSNVSTSTVVYVDIGYNAGPSLRSMQIRANDFASSNTWQDFNLTFIVPDALIAGLEFRVVNLNYGVTDLYVDCIAVDRGWGDSVVYAEGAYNKPKIAYGNPVSWSRFVDASSWSGIVLKASVSNASGSWLYGPYISSTFDGENMRGKPYVASFSLKVLSNLESSNVAYIDVSSSALGSVLQSKVIRANDFAAPNVWQDFNLTFIVPDLLVSGIEFRVENLNNGVTDLYVDRIAVYRGWGDSTVYAEAAYNKPKIAYGNSVSWSMLADASSWSGIVLKAPVSSASGSWLYGPYITETWDQMNIVGKPYTAVFTLKVSSRLSENDVCYLDVCCGAGGTILKSARVKASDFAASNVWQDFKLSFIVPDPLTYGLEFRVINLNGGITDLYIDKIALQKEWNDSTVYLEGAYNKPKIAYGNPVAWSKQTDPSSWSGIILKASASSASGSWLYGPYITTGLDGQNLFGKSFKAAFRLKVLSNLRTDDVAYIDVSCEQGTVILSSRMVRASDFALSDSWQDFQLTFTVPSSLTYGLEFRMVNLNSNVTDLSADIITIKIM
jgi:hypothetical protein